MTVFCFLKKYIRQLLPCSVLVLLGHSGFAQCKKEGELVQKIMLSLQRQDSLAYAKLFLSADSMTKIILRKAPSSSEVYQRALSIQSNYALLLNQDSLIQKQAIGLYQKVFDRGQRMDIHWDAILISRYELEKLGTTRDAALEAIAPERFVGYVFIEDMLTRIHYALTLSDMMKIEGKWYGGELNYLFKATTKDEFNAVLKADRIRIAKGIPDTLGHYNDSLRKVEEAENATISLKRKQVVDRKLYLGYLDNEIPVDLYIRYIKGDCSEPICAYEAIMKFGDNDFIRQEVHKNADGKWIFTEDDAGGVLELELKEKVFEGVFFETNDKIDYEAYLEERTMSKKKMENLDALIERDMER